MLSQKVTQALKVSTTISLLAVNLIAADGMRLAYKKGRAYSYQYNMNTNLSMHAELETDSTGHDATIKQNYNVNIELRLVHHNDDGSSLLWMKIKSIDASKGDQFDKTLDLATKIQLSRPIYFVQHSDGSIGKVYKNKNEKALVTNFKRGIIGAFQLRLRDIPETEDPSKGERGPVYTLSREENSIRKTWDTKSSGKDIRSAMESIGGRLRGEQIILLDKQEDVIARTKVSVSVEIAPTLRSETDIQTALNAHVQGGLSLVRTHLALPPLFNKMFIETDLQLEKLDNPLPSLEMTPTTFSQALQRLRTDSKSAEVIGYQIQSSAESMDTRLDLASALAQEGSANSQAILIRDVLQNAQLPGEILQRAMIGLLIAPRPSIAIMDAIAAHTENQNQETRYSALTTLGSMTYKLAQTDPCAAKPYIEKLQDYLNRPLDEAELAVILSALGNAGQESSLASLIPFLEHPSPALRREATDALRKLNQEEVSRLLLNIATQDNDPTVRSKAINIMDGRPALTLRNNQILTENKWKKSAGVSKLLMYGGGRCVCAQDHMELFQEITPLAGNKPWKTNKVEILSTFPSASGAGTTYCSAYLMGEKVYAFNTLTGVSINDTRKVIDKTFDSGPFETGQISQSFPIYQGITGTILANVRGRVIEHLKSEYNFTNPNDMFIQSSLQPTIKLEGVVLGLVSYGGVTPGGGGIQFYINNAQAPNLCEIRMKNGGKNKGDWSGINKLYFTGDEGFIAFLGSDSKKTFEIGRHKIKQYNKKIFDTTWVK